MNGILKNIYSALVMSQAWVALCFTLLCYYFQIINDLYNEPLLWIAYFGTLTAYNFAYWYTQKKLYWRLFVILNSLGICILIAINNLSLNSLVLLVALGIISLLYTLPLKTNSLRQVPGFKIYWIALVWSTTTLLPWLEHGSLQYWPIIFQSLSVFCFVVGITIPFDIRDLNLDNQKLNTIPQIIGIERSIRLSIQMLAISLALFFISVRFKIDMVSLAYLITILCSIALVRRSNRTHSRWFTSFWIEGLSTLPFVILNLL